MIRATMSALGLHVALAVSRAGAQTAIACAAPAGTPPTGITVSAAAPSVVVQWTKVTNARGYAVARRNPDGTCWNLTPLGTTANSVQEPIPSAPGTYQYQVAVQMLTGSTGISQWVPFSVAAPTVTVAPRTITLAGITATGTSVAVAPRTITLPGIAATGTSVAVAPRTITLPGITATGTSVAVAPRSITLPGITAAGTSVAVAPRTITLAGWTAAGSKRKP